MRVDPDPGGSFEPAGRDAVIGYGADNALLERKNVVAQADPDPFQIENRIAYQLAQPVVGNIAAAVGTKVGSADFSQELPVDEQVRLVAAFAQCVDVGMFDQQQVLLFGRSLLFLQQELSEEPLLYLPRFGVLRAAQILYANVLHRCFVIVRIGPLRGMCRPRPRRMNVPHPLCSLPGSVAWPVRPCTKSVPSGRFRHR